jgi:hypothetical protein
MTATSTRALGRAEPRARFRRKRLGGGALPHRAIGPAPNRVPPFELDPVLVAACVRGVVVSLDYKSD